MANIHTGKINKIVGKSLAESMQTMTLSLAILISLPFKMLFLRCQAGEELFPKDEFGELFCTEDDYVDTWKAMEECVDNGLVRSIGLANFNIDQLNRVSDMARIQPSVHQVVYQELSLH